MLRRLTLVLSISILLVSFAACGGDDAGGAASGPSSEGEARTTSGGEPIGPADEGVEGVEAFRVDSNDHTEENLTYDPAPPTGGEHFPVDRPLPSTVDGELHRLEGHFARLYR